MDGSSGHRREGTSVIVSEHLNLRLCIFSTGVRNDTAQVLESEGLGETVGHPDSPVQEEYKAISTYRPTTCRIEFNREEHFTSAQEVSKISSFESFLGSHF